MTAAEILRQLEPLGPKPPRKALRAAVAQKDAIIPELIAALDRVTAQAGELLKIDGYMLPIYALCLLAEFRDPRAFEPIRRFFSLPGEQALDLTGDLIAGTAAPNPPRLR
ncbi:MAG: DUF1186 domain-containing protein [Verrucomicrobiota bacterium]